MWQYLELLVIGVEGTVWDLITGHLLQENFLPWKVGPRIGNDGLIKLSKVFEHAWHRLARCQCDYNPCAELIISYSLYYIPVIMLHDK